MQCSSDDMYIKKDPGFMKFSHVLCNAQTNLSTHGRQYTQVCNTKGWQTQTESKSNREFKKTEKQNIS